MNKQEAIIFCDNIIKHFDNSDELTFYDLVKLTIKEDPKNPNGWGLYIHFVPFVEAYLGACINYPNSIIKVSR